MFRTIRHWLILKLAGKDTIVVNAVIEGEIKSHVSHPTLVANCTFYQDKMVTAVNPMSISDWYRTKREIRNYVDGE
jgi:hypothetical protein